MKIITTGLMVMSFASMAMVMAMRMTMTMTMTMGEMQWEYRTQLRHGFDPRTMAAWAVQRIHPPVQYSTGCTHSKLYRIYVQCTV